MHIEIGKTYRDGCPATARRARGTKRGQAVTFTGRLHKACGTSLRYQSSRTCVRCSIQRASARSAIEYATNREAVLRRNRESAKRWHAENPEAHREKMRGVGMRRHARKMGLTPAWCAPGTEAAEDIRDFYVLAPILTAAFKPATPYQVDHIKPLARGGEHRPDNLTWLPAAMNQAKGAKEAV